MPLPLVIEPEQLQALLQQPDPDEKLLIVDLSQQSVYQQTHVPGAVHLEGRALVCGEQPAPGKLPDKDTLSRLFSGLGLTPDSHVIAYDDEGGGWAGRLIWTLDMIGHTRYSYLNGGIHAWLAAGAPVESGTVEPQPSVYRVEQLDESHRASREVIQSQLGSDSMVIWDARSRDEYTGTRCFAQRGGHIPGAVHFEWTDGMDRTRQLRIRDPEELKQILADLGITADKEIITHCQTHHRSGFTYLLGKVLGFPNIKAYDGSWSEWGNLPDTPVEEGPF